MAKLLKGSYSLVIGPSISDVAGNLMDQDADGRVGQNNDTYAATVDLHHRDLCVRSVGGVSRPALDSETINVAYTVEISDSTRHARLGAIASGLTRQHAGRG